MRFINQNLHHTKQELNRSQIINEALERERESRVSKGQVNFAKDNEYYTPKEVVRYFGEFDYDPATTKEKAKEFDIKNYDTIETNGLLQNWSKYKKIWINPPFTEKHKFLKKAYDTYRQCPYIYIYILFPIEFLTTGRFHEITKGLGGKLYIPSGRIPFESGLGKQGKSPAFGSVVLKVQDKWEIELIDIEKLKGQITLF